MNRLRTTGVYLSLLALMFFSAIECPSFAAKKDKKQPLLPVPSQVLSHNDSLRYRYIFIEASRQQNAGNFAAAYELLSRCIAIDSTAAEAYFMQSSYLTMLHQDTLALRSLEKAAMLRPNNSTYQERLAQQFIGMGNYAKAIDVFERLAKAQPDRSDVLNMLVQLYNQQKEYDKMLNAINRLEAVEGENEQFEMARMNVYEQMGDQKNAYRTLKSLADSHPNDLSYSIMLGNWLMHNDKQQEAFKLFSDALKTEPDNSYAQSSMYDYYRSAGQDSLANTMKERILLGKNTPVNNRIQFLRQAIQEHEQQGGDSGQVISLLDRMQEVLPKDTNLAIMRVAYYTLKKMPEDSINNALVQLLELSPDNGGARFQLIQNKWKHQDWATVDSLSELGMLYNPDEMAFYYFSGLARYYQNNENGALESFQKGTAEINSKSDPKIVSDFYAIMGDIYHTKGERERAYAAYDSCLQWKPDHYITLNNYAYYLSLDKVNLKRAEEMSARTVKAEPKNGTYLDTYAWILYQENRYEEAKIYIDQALQNMNDSLGNAAILEHAGDIYLKTGDLEGAVKNWQMAIDKGGQAAALKKKIKRYSKQK